MKGKQTLKYKSEDTENPWEGPVREEDWSSFSSEASSPARPPESMGKYCIVWACFCVYTKIGDENAVLAGPLRELNKGKMCVVPKPSTWYLEMPETSQLAFHRASSPLLAPSTPPQTSWYLASNFLLFFFTSHSLSLFSPNFNPPLISPSSYVSLKTKKELIRWGQKSA